MFDLTQLSENGLLRYIARDLTNFSNAFGFMLHAALGHYFEEWDIECHFSVPRKELGLDDSKKPGDIDALLIPTFDGDRFAERSMAVEVKRFVVPPNKRGRSPDSYGTNQIKGLADDGFPFVGLLHIPLIHQSPRTEWIEIPVLKTGWRDIGESEFDGSLPYDPAMHGVTKRHEGRLERMQIPMQAGYNVFSIELDDRRDRVVGHSVNAWRTANKNAVRKQEIVEAIRTLKISPDCAIKYARGGGSVSNYNVDPID